MMAEAILEKIPAEKRWEISSKAFTGACVGFNQTLLRILGKEKIAETASKIWGEDGETFLPMIKETFKIPVKDAIGAANLADVAIVLSWGPECEIERIKETEKKVVDIWTKCPFWERAKEFGVTAQYDCVPGCSTWTEKGLEAINPKLMVRITKALPRGDPYCEFIYELKE
jgi:hypothetical protein